MAENKDGQEKSEPATAKRLHEARLRGQVSKSMDVTTASVLLLGGMVVFMLGGGMLSSYQNLMKDLFYNSGSIEINFANVTTFYSDILLFLAKHLLPILVIVFVIIFAAEVSQVGIQIATKKFSEGGQATQMFKPLSGLKKIFFSGRSFFELIKNFAKIFILGIVVYLVLRDESDNIIAMLDAPFMDIGTYMAELSFRMVLYVGGVYIIIAVADYIYQKHRYKEDMKMTKQEVKEETKQTEGDPKVKARLRSIMRSRLRQMMMKNVNEADVVITNPTHFAVALKYNQGEMNAPKVVAKGVDYLALQIREKATFEGIPIVEEPPLARTLFYNVEVDQEIPEDLFRAVAQILAYVYKLRRYKNN